MLGKVRVNTTGAVYQDSEVEILIDNGDAVESSHTAQLAVAFYGENGGLGLVEDQAKFRHRPV
jgi:hypothetical protein